MSTGNVIVVVFSRPHFRDRHATLTVEDGLIAFAGAGVRPAKIGAATDWILTLGDVRLELVAARDTRIELISRRSALQA